MDSESYFSQSKLLWTPRNPGFTSTDLFRRFINRKHGLSLREYFNLLTCDASVIEGLETQRTFMTYTSTLSSMTNFGWTFGNILASSALSLPTRYGSRMGTAQILRFKHFRRTVSLSLEGFQRYLFGSRMPG